MKNFAMMGLGVLVLAGCTEAPEAAKTPVVETRAEAPKKFGPSATGARLFREIEASEVKYVISPSDGSNGLGKYAVSVDGRSVWPPKGDGCSELVQCCEALTAIDDPNALSCLLAIGHDHACNVAQRTINKITRERGISTPASCVR